MSILMVLILFMNIPNSHSNIYTISSGRCRHSLSFLEDTRLSSLVWWLLCNASIDTLPFMFCAKYVLLACSLNTNSTCMPRIANLRKLCVKYAQLHALYLSSHLHNLSDAACSFIGMFKSTKSIF